MHVSSLTPGSTSGYNHPLETYGQKAFGKETFSSLEHSGSLSLNETTVTNKLVVNGTLRIDYAILSILKVNGMCHAWNSKVSGLAKINGTLIGHNTHFQDIHVSSDSVDLTSCEVENISLLSCPNSNRNERTLLLKGTWVKGSINVEGDPAVIVMDSSSRIDGSVTNARIENSH